jgi:hypothetical protein
MTWDHRTLVLLARYYCTGRDDMKVQSGENTIVIGKRVALGGMVGSVATVFASIYPERAVAIMGSVTAVTFFLQILIGHFASITTK